MKTKYLSFVLTFTFLFLLPDSVFSQKKEVRKEFWGEGKLKSEKHYKDGRIDGFFTVWHKNGKKHFFLAGIIPGFHGHKIQRTSLLN